MSVRRCGLDSDSVTGSCEHGNQPPGSINGVEFLDDLSYYHLLMKYSAPWS
jgi:hypothetical protein